MKYDAKKVGWEKVEILEKECLFCDVRIDRETVPDGYFVYEVRHSDEDWGEPCEIALGILVNFYGTILTKEKFELENDGSGTNPYLIIEWDKDWWFLGDQVILE